MDNNEKKTVEKDEREIDLGIFLSLLIRVTKKIGRAIVWVFRGLGDAFLDLLLFLKRKLIWLAVGGVVGLLVGFFLHRNSGPIYYSNMVIRTNFESSRYLYNKIDYFNSLIKEGRNAELAQVFGISVDDASKLNRFEIEPIDDELQMVKMYKENFLTYKRNSNLMFDTAWSRTLSYGAFKRHLTTFDFPLHQISLTSLNPDVYPKVQQGILKLASINPILVAVKNETLKLLADQEKLVMTSLSGIDSLRRAYNKRIAASTETSSNGANLVLTEREVRNPEIDLYDKELLLKDELVSIRKNSVDQQEIFQIYSDFNNVGMRSPALQQAFTKYPGLAIVITLIILILIEIFKQLNKVERQRKLKRSAPDM